MGNHLISYLHFFLYIQTNAAYIFLSFLQKMAWSWRVFLIIAEREISLPLCFLPSFSLCISSLWVYHKPLWMAQWSTHFFERVLLSPATGPLHLLFPVPGLLFPLPLVDWLSVTSQSPSKFHFLWEAHLDFCLLVQGFSLPPSNFPHSRILSPFMMILFSICLPHLITPVLLPLCYHCPQGTWHSLAGWLRGPFVSLSDITNNISLLYFTASLPFD